MEWLFSNAGEIWLALAQVVTLASVVVKLTPAKWDDKLVSKVMKLLSLAK